MGSSEGHRSTGTALEPAMKGQGRGRSARCGCCWAEAHCPQPVAGWGWGCEESGPTALHSCFPISVCV